MIDWLLGLDATLFLSVNRDWASSLTDIFFPFLTDLHKRPVFLAIALPGLMAIFYFYRRATCGLTFFFLIFATAFSDFFGSQFIKKLVQRPRPFDTIPETIQRCPAGGFSFISNHAMNIFTFCTFLALVFPKARWPLLVLAFLVAYSRVYCGVHYPLDVICGAMLGIGVGSLAHYGLSRYKERPWPKF